MLPAEPPRADAITQKAAEYILEENDERDRT